jgi:hypothetical protein
MATDIVKKYTEPMWCRDGDKSDIHKSGYVNISGTDSGRKSKNTCIQYLQIRDKTQYRILN